MKIGILSYLLLTILICADSCTPKNANPVVSKVENDSISQLIIQFNMESNTNSIIVCDLTDRVISFQTTGFKFNQVKNDLQFGPKSFCMKMKSQEIAYLCDSIFRDFKPVDYRSSSISSGVTNVQADWKDDVIIVNESARYSSKILIADKDGKFREFGLFCKGTRNQLRMIRYLISTIKEANSDTQLEQYLTDLSSKYK